MAATKATSVVCGDVLRLPSVLPPFRALSTHRLQSPALAVRDRRRLQASSANTPTSRCLSSSTPPRIGHRSGALAPVADFTFTSRRPLAPDPCPRLLRCRRCILQGIEPHAASVTTPTPPAAPPSLPRMAVLLRPHP
ncbi:hypothetical protein BU16DRAFT_532939 [Lophium mytilinum]|uniref:Uncharacterized protein n=1 Tax=Lophium mytilinum TaxID=390894 RepID=A0A6A6RDV3_9PEZI|nr:hypothetical protein BU16DRAFT_532939 [Lophium mytilinum]